MSPVTHFLTGWAIANSCPVLDVKERALVTVGGVIPDIDGLGAVAELLTRESKHPLNWFSLYHHQLHTLVFALIVSILSFVLSRHRWSTSLLVFFSFHVHLFEDILGGRGPDGYQWPIPYLKPFSARLELAWRGQWALNAWPNFAITVCLLALTFYLAWTKGRSPLEMVSARAENGFIATLQQRFPRSRAA